MTDATEALLKLAAELQANTSALRENTEAIRSGRAQASTAPRSSSSGGGVFPNYGKAKGQSIAGASMTDLNYYAEGARKSIANPEKARWRDKETALLAEIEREIQRQSGGRAGQGSFDAPPDFGTPPPADEDIPF